VQFECKIVHGGARRNYSSLQSLDVQFNNDRESRKAIVDEFMKQVGLSKAAANTYYQMIKRK